jgi:hypothetical protein
MQENHVMNYLNNIAAIVEAISQQWLVIKARAGDEWPQLEARLLAALRDLAKAKNEAEAKELITEVLFLGYYTSASAIFRRIMQAYPLDGGLVEVSRLGGHFTTRGDKSLESTGAGEDVTLTTLRGGVAETIAQLQTATSKAVSEPPGARYLNAGFFNDAGEYVEPTQPLYLERGAYQLVVNIGQPWGPGVLGEPWPDDKLEEAFAEFGALALDVVASGHADLNFTTPIQKIRLSAKGESESCTFPFTIRKAGRKFIDVDVLYNGHLLQARRLEIQVIASGATPDENLPMQHGYITWTRTAVLTPESLQTLVEKPRRLTIALGRHEEQVGLRFYDCSGQALAFQAYELQESGLKNLMAEIRAQLFHMMGGYHAVGGPPQTLLAYLGPLAELGSAFFRNLFPPDEDFSPVVYHALQLEAGQIIQVAPLSKQLSVPWEAIYDRPIESYDPARITLCDTYRQHGPEADDCPHQEDPTVLCPHGFWGFRYIVEQLPYRVDPNEPPAAPDASVQVRNGIPLHMNAILHTKFNGLGHHLQQLRELSPDLLLAEIRDKESARRAFQDNTSPPDMIYFYTHGGLDRSQSYVSVGETEQIKEGDLHAWKPSFWQKRPLIFINACESAAYNPDSFENMLQFFARHGASGVIATQCPVLERLADAVSIRFLRAFWQQRPAGLALYQTRRELLLADNADPRGLAYSLFASADVQLAQPIIQT